MDLTWMRRAACAGKSALFFPSRGGSARLDPARKVCAACPVQLQCREYAETLPNLYRGLWGGMMPDELRADRATVGNKECAYPPCREMVPIFLRARPGRVKRYCSHNCYKQHWREKNPLPIPSQV